MFLRDMNHIDERLNEMDINFEITFRGKVIHGDKYGTKIGFRLLI